MSAYHREDAMSKPVTYEDTEYEAEDAEYEANDTEY